MDYSDFIETYENQAAGLDKEGRLEVFFRAMHDADQTGNISVRIQIRQEIIMEAMEAVRDDLIIAVYPSMLALLNEATDQDDRNRILWYYKGALYHLPNFLQPTRAMIEAMLNDFERLYLSEGAPMFQVHIARRSVYRSLCDVQNSLRQQAFIDSITPSWEHPLQDDQARVTQWEGDVWCFAGHYEKVFRVYKPLLEEKIRHRGFSNINTWATLLWPAWKLNRIEEGDAYYQMVLNEIDYHPSDTALVSEALLYGALRGLHEDCAMLLREWMPDALKEVHQRYSLEFYACAVPALKLIRKQGKYALRMQVQKAPAGFPEALRSEYSTDELAAWCERAALETARQYDARNGNTYLQEWVNERLNMEF